MIHFYFVNGISAVDARHSRGPSGLSLFADAGIMKQRLLLENPQFLIRDMFRKNLHRLWLITTTCTLLFSITWNSLSIHSLQSIKVKWIGNNCVYQLKTSWIIGFILKICHFSYHCKLLVFFCVVFVEPNLKTDQNFDQLVSTFYLINAMICPQSCSNCDGGSLALVVLSHISHL